MFEKLIKVFLMNLRKKSNNMSYEEYTVKVYSDGTIKWFNQNDQLHRLDGPAVEYSDGDKHWFQNDQLHRLDGPSVEYPNGSKYWHIEGKYYTEKEFNRQVNSCNNKTVIIDGKEYQLIEKK